MPGLMVQRPPTRAWGAMESLVENYVHFLWSAWDGRPLVTVEIEDELHRVIRAVRVQDFCARSRLPLAGRNSAFRVRGDDLQVLTHYIQNQRAHHAVCTVDPQLEPIADV